MTVRQTAKRITHYSSREELANSISHGAGVAFAIFGAILLLHKAIEMGADRLTLFSYVVYSASMILLYLASTLYHLTTAPQLKHRFKIVDHCAIYLLIAGTYTPFLLVSLRTPLAFSLMAIIWAIALLGIVFKIVFVHRFQVLSLIVYLVMGWLSLVVIYQLYHSLSLASLILLGLGGVVYSLGVFFYVKRSIPYNHAIWHLFVLGGTALHFAAVYGDIRPAV